MKSSTQDLRKRGMADTGDMNRFNELQEPELLELLYSDTAVYRTAAVRILTGRGLIGSPDFVGRLLERLKVEKCLYTRLAICEALETGDSGTAALMVQYLGCIGNNRHSSLPNKVSQKAGYPLARDIIARSLAKMDSSVLSVLIEVLYGKNTDRISEVLDAIGSIVFYHQNIMNRELFGHISATMDTYTGNPVIIWKCVLCLSAFPLTDSIRILEHILESDYPAVIKGEAERSLKAIGKRLTGNETFRAGNSPLSAG